MKSSGLSSIGVVFLMAAMAVLVGCSSGDSLLESVPSTARAVVNVHADEFLKEAGCQLQGSKVTLSSELNSFLDGIDNGNALKDLLSSGAVDLESMVSFITSDGVSISTARLMDVDKFEAYFETLGLKWAAHGDFNVAQAKGCDLLVRDDQCWAVTGGNSVAVLERVLKNAEKKPVTDVPGIKDALTGDGQLRFAVNLGNDIASVYGSEYQNSYLTGIMGVNGELFNLDMEMVSSKGKSLKIAPSLGKIDPEFLNYLSTQDAAVIAMSFKGDTDWPALIKALAPRLSLGNAMMLSAIDPYLSQIDGTVAVAIGPAGAAESLTRTDAWNFTVVAKMKRGGARQVVDKLKGYISQARIPTTEEEGLTVVAMPDMTVRFGEKDGYFVATNREMLGNGMPDLAPDFDGKRFAGYIDIPYNSEMMKASKMPYGFNIVMASDDKKASLKLRLNGANMGILEAVIAEAAKKVKNP